LNAPLPEPKPAQPVGDAIPPVLDRSAPFIADGRRGPDLLDTANTIRPIVEVVSHRESQTPMMIAVVGPSGAGKSFTLDRIVAGVETLAAAARTTSGPFLDDVLAVSIDAAAAGQDPVTTIAAATYAALTRDAGDGRSYAALADEAAHAGADPHAAASKAIERHDEARRRLETERQSRDETEARRARLTEVVLFETPGSRVDAYARASRGRIEGRLRRFDLVSGDPVANFKDLVRDLASAGGGSRVGVALRALWGYRSQVRLLLAAIVFFVLAFAASQLGNPGVASWLAGLGASGASIGNWLTAHSGWIDDAVAALAVLGALALALNLWRAFLFTGTLLRGVRLLNVDVRERGRDLDAALARANRRIEALTAEAEMAARHAEAAEKRAKARGAATPAPGPAPLFLEPASAPQIAARAFLTALDRMISGRPDAAPPPVSLTPAPPITTPTRIVFALDNLDALPPKEALALVETVHALLGRSFVAICAFDPASLQPAFGDAAALRARLERLFQIAFNVRGAGEVGGERLAARLIAGAGSAPNAPIEARQSALSEPLSSGEAAVLTAIAPLAASTPRAVKRFLNVYRLARVGVANRAALALALAAEQSEDGEARAALDRLLTEAGEGPLDDPAGPPALLAALRASRALHLGVITGADMRSATAVAKRYQFFG
jgi:hypothetical protein